jgi:transposase
MEVLYRICCGLDVHQATVVACVRRPGQQGRRTSEVQTFGTTTPELLHLADWLTEQRVTHVAMESTGVLWKPVFNILEGSFQVILVNARHFKAVPGRKTDVKDSEWLAQLLEHGRLRASFIPPRPIRELRDLTRYRKTLIEERTREANRVQKLLESANLKLRLVATDILGASGRAILRALVAGERDGAVLAELAKGTLRQKRARLAEALTGRFTDHHATLLGELLAPLEYLEAAMARLCQRIEAVMQPYATHVEHLQSIPGVNREAAETLIAEIGVAMSRFPSAAHLASWAGICPGNHESAGKRKTGKTRQGDRWLKPLLIECGWGAGPRPAHLLGRAICAAGPASWQEEGRAGRRAQHPGGGIPYAAGRRPIPRAGLRALRSLGHRAPHMSLCASPGATGASRDVGQGDRRRIRRFGLSGEAGLEYSGRPVRGPLGRRPTHQGRARP